MQETCTISCACALVWDQVPEYSQMIMVIIWRNGKGHNLSRRFIDFGKQYEWNIYGKDSVIFLLQHLGFMRNLKKCGLDPVQEIEFLWLTVNFLIMTLSLPEKKIRKIKDQCLSLYKTWEVSFLDLTKQIEILSSTIQSVLTARLQFRF